MLKLDSSIIQNKDEWEKAGVVLPVFDIQEMKRKTNDNPEWIHFGPGNIFRGFIAALQQDLLDRILVDTGIIAVAVRGHEIIDRIYKPYDNLSLLVTMHSNGNFDKKIIASISESLVGDPSRKADWLRLKQLFIKPSLQIASFTITEKGYNLTKMSGEFFPEVEHDVNTGPEDPQSAMGKVAALAFERYKNGAYPIAFVSMDNCSHNGEKLFEAVETIAYCWIKKGYADNGFPAYIKDRTKVTFPWSVIDKITPGPSESVNDELKRIGIESTGIVQTSKNSCIAPFVNAEGPQYLVIEDDFPGGRPPLEKAGVIFTDRSTVDKFEKMKVCTCLNPLHTALAVFGCLLGYTSIAEEMKNPLLKKLVEKVGYDEGVPVAVNPGIIDPNRFIREVIEIRFTNPFIPDTPQRIASDTSQKVGIRFGETIKAYSARDDLDPSALKYIPLVIAGWCRYLMGVDDKGVEMPLSSDPMLTELTAHLADVKFGSTQSVGKNLVPILSNSTLFGSDLYAVGLGEKIEKYFTEMIAGPGAVAATLERYLEQFLYPSKKRNRTTVIDKSQPRTYQLRNNSAGT
jgi:fructuronate reductase